MDLLSIGETMGLFAPQNSEPLATGPLCALTTGGAESNVAKAVASLGSSAAWFSAVGDDPFGTLILDDLRAAGVDTSLVLTRTDARTGIYAKDPSPSGSTVHYYRDGSAASQLRSDDLARIGVTPRLVHISGITPALSPSCDELISSIVHGRRFSDAVVSFDVNHRRALWPDHDSAARRLEDLAGASDIVFVGLDEAEHLWGTTTADAVRDLFPRVKHLVVKDAANAATEYERHERTVERAASVAVVEPVGAGDAFAGGWLSGWLSGADSPARLRLGHLMASRVLRSTSDFAPPPTAEERRTAVSAEPPQWPTWLTSRPLTETETA